MKTRITTLVAISALAMLSFGLTSAEAQSTHFDLELGYQWVDVDGDEDLYRTQVNQSNGVVLKGLSISHIDSSGEAKIADSFRIDASGFGGNPAGRFRLWAGLGKAYRFRLFYSEYENFSALPAYANPAIDDGVTPGQHTWERDRQILDMELQILPNRMVTPLIGYRRNVIEGPRTTTYRAGQNEYRLSSELKETEQEIYAGITFKAGTFFGTLIQGWREYDASDSVTLATGERYGNIGVPILGVDQYIDGLTRSTTTEAETPVTTANVQGRLGDAVDVVLTYVRADSEGEATSNEMLSGSLVSYRINRFFQSFDQTVASRTDNPFWRAEGRFKVHISESVRLDLGLEESHRSLEGWTLISNLYLDTLNFGGHDPQDIQELVDAHNGYDRSDQVVNARLNVGDVGPLSFWAEAGYRKSNLRLSEDVSQIVTPGGQEGSFDRKTTFYGAGAAFDFNESRISLDIVNESADEIVVRTDFDDRLRIRARIDLRAASWLRVLGTAETIDSSNNAAGVGYDTNTDHFALDFNFEPTENLTFRLAWDNYSTDSSMPILVPHDLSRSFSEFEENGTLLEGSVIWRIARFTFDLGYSEFDNEGSFEFDLERAFLRVGLDFTDHWAAAAEFESRDYTEEILDLAHYDASRFGVYLRWHR